MWLEMDDIPPVEQLGETEIEPLLLELSEQTFSGVARYEGSERDAQLLFEEGFVFEVLTRPTREEERLGSMLRLGEQVSEAELEQARARADRDGTTLQTTLQALGILEAEHVRQAATSRLSYLLHQLCDAEAGDVSLYQPSVERVGTLPPADLRSHVAPEQIVFRRRFERFSQLEPDEWEGMIDIYGEMYPKRSDRADGRIERSFADDAHRRLGRDFIDGRHSFEQIITHSPLPPGETIAVVSALRSMKLVDFHTTIGPGVQAERFQEIVETKYLSVHKASYFEVLNIHWSSYDEVTDRAYEMLRERYDTDHLPSGLPTEIRQKAQEIAERIETAYEVLKYRETRHKYRQKIMPDYKLEHAIPLLLKKADLAEQRDQFDLAEDALRRVLEIEPEHRDAKGRLEGLERD